MIAPAQAYIICATPRSGSTLLCDLLTETGVAGRPNSFFRRESIPWYVDHFKLSAADWSDESAYDRSYLAAILGEGAGGTPVFGMRLMWESLADLSTRLGTIYPSLPSDSARFQSAFRPAVYLHLSREDKVAQAISRLRAEQSGLWHVHADGTERERLTPEQALVYDSRAISEFVTEAEEHDASWMRWFAREGIQPMQITYEALSAEPRSVLASILSTLGLDPAFAESVEPKTAKLASDTSHEWAARFRKERGDKSA